MGMTLEAEPCTAYSFALHHAGLGPLALITARNDTPGEMPATDAFAYIDAVSGRWRIRIPELGPGEGAEVAVDALDLDRDALERMVRPAEASLRLELGSANTSAPLLLLAPWQWPVFSSALPALAACVLKHDGIVRTLISESRLWKPGGGRKMTPDRSQSSDHDAPVSMLERIFRHLSDNHLITYAEPLVTRHPSGAVFQDIRPPHRILHNRRDCIGEATCIDLTLLIAGCLEGMGLAPLLLLVLDIEGVPVHAFLGVWLRAQPRIHPVIRDPAFLDQVAARGDLLLIETTAVCEGSRRAEFDEAIRQGRENLTSCRRLVALDIAALRPPMGMVLPMETPYESSVLLALAEAAELARVMASSRFETLHLLFGLVRAGGEISTRLLDEAGVAAAGLEEEVRLIMTTRRRDGRRVPTVGYDQCINEATENARSQGSTIVRECDLWWAVLRSRSRSVEAALENSGCPQTTLVPLLDILCPQSRSTTTIG